eukprot:CAMPEP_0173434692 /NCGR_PEP_ID=MMETSP1357-20121228/13182_1 /TAXON_ID=77926 /ORGANISM="Hemiselmis rufescens, Strain PCC563" /LENGTH=320 /DNA_ID=CAMNT_0014399575 /DNA_START=22 /DNA_END=984 /DNA_ORIENTATION=+
MARNPSRLSLLLGVAALVCLLMVIPTDGKSKATGSGSADLADVDGDDLLEGVIGDKDAEAALDEAMEDDGDDDGEDDLDGDGDDSEGSESDSDDDEEDEGADTTKALRSEIEFFKEHDKDADGHLTLAEYKAAMNVVHQDAQEEEADKSGEAGEGAVESKPEESMLESDFNEEDANKDGKLSLDEWLLATFHEEPQDEEEGSDADDEEEEEPMTAQEIADSRKEAEAEFAGIDTNKDKTITEPEMLAYVREQEKKENEADSTRIPLTETEILESVAELFGELDKDKDGKVLFPEFFEVQYDVPRARQDEKPAEGEAPKIA